MIDNQVYAPIQLIAGALGAETVWDQKKKSVYIDSNMPLLASILEKKTCLYALNEDEEESGQYKGMILSINGKNRVVDWESIAMLSDLPQLEYMDLNGDRKEELVVILSHAEGTGSAIQEIHVINPRNFDEYEKENPIDVIESRVEITKLSSQEAEIKIGKKKTHVNLKDISMVPAIAEMPADFFYENYIKYEVTEGNILRATVGVEVKPLSNETGGTVLLSYFINSLHPKKSNFPDKRTVPLSL